MLKSSTLIIEDQNISNYIDQIILVEPSNYETEITFFQLPQMNEFLIINFDNEIHYTNRDSNDRRLLRAEGSFLLGKANHKRTFKINLKNPICLIKFKPCSFYIFSDQSPQHYINNILTLDCPVSGYSHDKLSQEISTYFKSNFNPKNVEELSQKRMFDIIQHIENNLSSTTVQAISENFNISDTTIYRYFKKYIGTNLTSHIKHLKFHHMLSKIYTDDYNASSAIEIGFFDQSHFIKEFKKIYDATPSQFLKNLDILFQNDSASRDLFELCYIKS